MRRAHIRTRDRELKGTLAGLEQKEDACEVEKAAIKRR
jgi:hypothetical protein